MKLSKVLNNYRLFHWICFHDQRGFAVRNKLFKHFTEVMRHLLTDKNTYPLDLSLNRCPLCASVIVHQMAFLIISFGYIVQPINNRLYTQMEKIWADSRNDYEDCEYWLA